MNDADRAASEQIGGAVDELVNKLERVLGPEMNFAAERGVAISIVITAPMPSGALYTALRSNASSEMLASISRAFASAAEDAAAHVCAGCASRCTSPGGAS